MRTPSASSHQLISLIRHADAGSRERFIGEDSLRPLSRRGRREAEAISRRLEEGSTLMVSSPFLRCMETLAPLSFRLHRAISPTPELAEGEQAEKALAFLLDCLGRDLSLVACSHGDVMTGIVEICSGNETPLVGHVNLDKGSTTELWVEEGRVTSLSFVAPPVR